MQPADRSPVTGAPYFDSVGAGQEEKRSVAIPGAVGIYIAEQPVFPQNATGSCIEDR